MPINLIGEAGCSWLFHSFLYSPVVQFLIVEYPQAQFIVGEAFWAIGHTLPNYGGDLGTMPIDEKRHRTKQRSGAKLVAHFATSKYSWWVVVSIAW
jgi:hypothetical protein